MNKKVLICVNHDIVIYNFRKELVKELNLQAFEVYISSPLGPRLELLKDMATIIPTEHLSRRSKNPFSDFKLFKEYLSVIKDIKPSIILTYTIKPNIYASLAAQRLNIPYFTTITGLGAALNKGIKSFIPNLMYKVALKKAKRVFFQNQHNLDYMKKRKMVNDNVVLVPGSGVNTEEFSYQEYPGDKKLHFIFVGRVMKAKGIEEYLWLAKTIKEKYDNIRFHVIGDMEEDYTLEIEELVKEDIIEYHGVQASLHDYYKMCHAIIHPSKYSEGISNVLLEAASTGRPILTTNIPGCQETFIEGKTGFGFEPNNKHDLLEKFEQFLKVSQHDKEKMGLASRKWIEMHFDRKKVVDAYMKGINSK